MALHLALLGERSFHHDESIHARAAYDLAHGGDYRYDPTYHGPLLYYLTAVSFRLAGDSDFTARLPVALAGVALVGVAWSLRRPFGHKAALWTGILATVSPTLLYYGRFLRMDLLELLTASLAALLAWHAARGRPGAWPWAGVGVGLALATKENAYVTAFLVALVAAVQLLARGRRGLTAAAGWLRRHRWGLLAAGSTAAATAVVLYTVGFVHPGDWSFPVRAVAYWWEQHEVERVGGPPWYHLPRLAIYELLPILAATVWAVRRWRRLRPVESSLWLFGVGSVAIYAYLGEKVPWLGSHQVWAFLPLAGAQLARTFSRRGRLGWQLLAGTGVAATAATAVVASFVTGEVSPHRDRVEALVYVQTCPEMRAVAEEGRELAAGGHDPVAAVAGTATWPLSWYWRQAPVWWAEPLRGSSPPLVVCDPDREGEVRRRLGPGYTAEHVPLRAWWIMAGTDPGLADVVRYLLTRRPWSPVGAAEVVVLRAGEPPPVRREVAVPEVLERELGATSAEVLGAGYLAEPRGLAVARDGRVAVADPAVDAVLLFDKGRPTDIGPADLDQPEDVAWAPGGALVVADTWRHRVLVVDPATGRARPLPPPPGGFYGPRGVAVAPDGTVAVTDTGSKRVVLYPAGPSPAPRVLGGPGEGPGQLDEPVGIDWIDDRRLVVCDTGNRRLQVLLRDGSVERIVPLPEAWSEIQSRPSVAVVGPELWVVTDPPATALWVVRGGTPTLLRLGGEIRPSAAAAGDGDLWITDLAGRVLRLVL